MISGSQMVEQLVSLGITHVVWLPDSALGQWNEALESCPQLTLVRVCREGEAWAVAAGLQLGGARPLVMIQCTGLFESGDALRNVLFDYRIPLFAFVGYRSYLVEGSPDTARIFTEPFLEAFGIDYRLISKPDDWGTFAEHYTRCFEEGKPGVVLFAEGRM